MQHESNMYDAERFVRHGAIVWFFFCCLVCVGARVRTQNRQRRAIVQTPQSNPAAIVTAREYRVGWIDCDHYDLASMAP
jgi:hypothetical protein